jgi:uncharacterized protein
LWNRGQIPISAVSQVEFEEDGMTPEERGLIEGLFDRMERYGAPEKDREAEALIHRRVRALPDAVYMLTQSVLVQEQALEAANARAVELEDRLRELEESGAGQPRRSGSFLGGGFLNRGRDPEGRPSSVPQVGARATPSTYDRPSAWGQSAAAPAAPAAGGGGFMRSAMATAAGVAGGVLVAESIRNMLGGSQAKAADGGAKEDHKQAAAQENRADEADRGDFDSVEEDSVDSHGDFGDDSIDI